MEDHIRFDARERTLFLLDQRLLPEQEHYVACRSVEDVIRAMQGMVVRGAPAIGVTAAWGCVLALDAVDGPDWQELLGQKLSLLAKARPTAVNLRWAVERMQRCLQRTLDSAGLEREAVLPAWEAEAWRIQREDVEICQAIGRHGGELLQDGDTVLTHCNAGALATAGYGTALGVVRGAVAAGKRIAVIADETRPLFQGARLTAWELQRDGIPVTVACDNACALLMGKGLVQCVVTGADRIAANGDTANKIGTCAVAILARHFGIPFYVAAPLSTIDTDMVDGSAIPLEQRPEQEVTHVGTARICPVGVPAYNFAFDVTPAAYIQGIVTEVGVLRPPYTESIRRAFDRG
ncbi:MAG: S-methyl-5-thioribose-1-phosphate isomerase [Desulfovibrio sp.]|nr:S-methyl-5-thioribose-1-phosphate isomerase [Desulfovibrio sp.]